MIWRRAVLLACPPLAVTIAVYRSGYLGPLLFGVRQWRRAQWVHTRVYPETEPEIVA